MRQKRLIFLLIHKLPVRENCVFLIFFSLCSFHNVSIPIFLKNIYLFIWLCQVLVVACGIFSCGMRTLGCSMWDIVPWPGNLGPLHWEHGVLATGAPGSPHAYILANCSIGNRSPGLAAVMGGWQESEWSIAALARWVGTTPLHWFSCLFCCVSKAGSWWSILFPNFLFLGCLS